MTTDKQMDALNINTHSTNSCTQSYAIAYARTKQHARKAVVDKPYAEIIIYSNWVSIDNVCYNIVSYDDIKDIIPPDKQVRFMKAPDDIR